MRNVKRRNIIVVNKDVEVREKDKNVRNIRQI